MNVSLVGFDQALPTGSTLLDTTCRHRAVGFDMGCAPMRGMCEDRHEVSESDGFVSVRFCIPVLNRNGRGPDARLDRMCSNEGNVTGIFPGGLDQT